MSVTEPVYISYLNYIGSGAPADGDQITRDNSQYPLNCVYTDRDSGITYVRKATTKVAATDWQAGGGAATEVTVYQLKTVLTQDQILALPTTPIELVPAPGVGKALLFMRAFYNLIKTTDLYVFNASATVNILIDTQDASNYVRLAEWFNGSISGTNKIQALATPVNYAGTDGLEGSIKEQAGCSYENVPLTLAGWNGGAASYSGGDPSNTLEVTVVYSIIDL